jgi:neutral ceramidase
LHTSAFSTGSRDVSNSILGGAHQLRRQCARDGPDVNILVGVLGIGNVGLASIQGEAYNLIAQGVKAKSPMANTVFVGLANGQANSGYIPTDDAFGRQTFQVLNSRLKPGCAETSVQDAMVDMLTQYATGLAANK